MTGGRGALARRLALGALVAVAACNVLSGVDDIEFTSNVCDEDLDCADDNPCDIESCGPNRLCVSKPLSDGPAGQQVPGDCKTAVCSAGSAVLEPDATDADDGNPCTLDACTDGEPSHEPIDGEACSIGELFGACSAGMCVVNCTDTTDCEDGNPCTVDSCDVAGQTCVNEPNHGALVEDADPTDCVQLVCDGASAVMVPDDSEIPDDENSCTDDACLDGSPMITPLPGKDCPAGICNSQGACVGCNTPTDCEGTDDECKTKTCVARVCGMQYSPSGTPVAAQTAGDCKEVVCNGSGGTVVQADSGDVPSDNGDPCTTPACSGSQPVFQPAPPGTPCGNGVCSATGVCVECLDNSDCNSDMVCVVNTCKKSTGQSCSAGSQCASTFCVDGFCCNGACTGLCEACSAIKSIGPNGTCADMTVGTDPDDECGGFNQYCCNNAICGSC